MAIELGQFIEEWSRSAVHERANFQPFIIELCELLDVAKPDKAGPVNNQNSYVFERPVTFHHANNSSSSGFIDLYKRGCFVMEAKQGGHRGVMDYTRKLATKAMYASIELPSQIDGKPKIDEMTTLREAKRKFDEVFKVAISR
jgi:hypothetical protein